MMAQVLEAYYYNKVLLNSGIAFYTKQKQHIDTADDGNLDTEPSLLKWMKAERQHEKKAHGQLVQTVRRPGGEVKDNLSDKNTNESV